jgi:hypothetical protein
MWSDMAHHRMVDMVLALSGSWPGCVVGSLSENAAYILDSWVDAPLKQETIRVQLDYSDFRYLCD